MKAIALLVVVLLTCVSVSAQEPPGSIGYRTAADAYEALRKDPNAKFSTQAGWVTVDVRSGPNSGIWSFTPDTHPAHPAVIKRTIIQVGGSISLGMQVLCGATKRECDQLVEEFKHLNAQIKHEIQDRQKGSK
jgi:hypothetical protein